MSAQLAWAAVLGMVLGLGLWMILSATPRFGAPRLHERVAPYVADVSEQAFTDVTRRHSSPLPFMGANGSMAATLVSRVAGLLPQPGSLDELALRQVGRGITLSEYRARRALWLLAGTLAGTGLVAVLASTTQLSLLAILVVPAVTGLGGFMLCGMNLKKRAAKRVAAISEQVPAVWEFLALSVAAGEGLPDALRRVAHIGHGDLVEELHGVVTQVEVGVPVGFALQHLATELHIPSLSRGVEQIISALDRGTPIATVLRDQAMDAREDSKRRLLESAGQKEVAMLIPLVFLILPITIVFAIFPGLFVIQAGF